MVRRIKDQRGQRTAYEGPRFPKDAKSQAQRAWENEQSLLRQPLSDRHGVSESAKNARIHAWAQWTDYFNNVAKTDPNEVILDLCRNPALQEKAKLQCQKFLKYYVENSETERPCLGPSETRWVLTVTSVTTVMETWKSLIMYAETHLLQDMRRRDPGNSEQWSLSVEISGPRARGPIYEISMWIMEKLVDEYHLTRRLKFEKYAATSEEILLILSTVWYRADLIPCDPDIRVDFSIALLLAGITGFRTGAVVEIFYDQVELAIVRDPDDPRKTKLVATITMYHNKLKKNAMRLAHDDVVRFSISFVPCQTICLASYIAARALSEDAFEAGFKSMEELLRQPILEHVNYVPLKWKDEVRGKGGGEGKGGGGGRLLVRIGYFSFWKLWNRAVWLLCLRDDLRPYSTRVGAGANLNGSLEPVLRNWVLGHSGDVFRKSYRPNFLPDNLMKLAFKEQAGAGENDVLCQLHQSVSQKRDEFAPIDATPEDQAAFEEREDIRNLRADFQEARDAGADDTELGRIRSKIYYRLTQLADLKAVERRQQYFDEADRLRSRGLGTGALRAAQKAAAAVPATSGLGARAVGVFLQGLKPENAHRSVRFVDILLAFLRHRPASVAVLVASEPGSALVLDDNDGNADGIICPPGPSRCLLGCASFANPRNLTRHYQNCHLVKGTFDGSFQCPVCLHLYLRQGAPFSIPPPRTISSPSQWSAHIATEHRRAGLGPGSAPNPDVPYLPSWSAQKKQSSRRPRAPRSAAAAADADADEMFPCRLCERSFPTATGRSKHTTAAHFKNGAASHTVQCLECRRKGRDSAVTGDVATWRRHEKAMHDGGEDCAAGKTAALEKKKRGGTFLCWFCERSFPSSTGRSLHTASFHFGKGACRRGEAVACLECCRQGKKPVVIEGSIGDWRRHEKMVHGGGGDGSEGGELSCLFQFHDGRNRPAKLAEAEDEDMSTTPAAPADARTTRLLAVARSSLFLDTTTKAGRSETREHVGGKRGRTGDDGENRGEEEDGSFEDLASPPFVRSLERAPSFSAEMPRKKPRLMDVNVMDVEAATIVPQGASLDVDSTGGHGANLGLVTAGNTSYIGQNVEAGLCSMASLGWNDAFDNPWAS